MLALSLSTTAAIVVLVNSHWQLPTYNGTKSYQNLLVEVYGKQTSDSLGFFDRADAQVHFSPIYMGREGEYSYISGKATNRGTDGTLWQSTSHSASNAKDLVFHSTFLGTLYASDKGRGYSLRCLVR